MSTAKLDLRVRRDSDGLHRVLSVCRRRGIEVLTLIYMGGDTMLVVQGDEARIRQLDRWLAALVDVVEVSSSYGRSSALTSPRSASNASRASSQAA
jgi:acetolactate synthase regulatory subunit